MICLHTLHARGATGAHCMGMVKCCSVCRNVSPLCEVSTARPSFSSLSSSSVEGLGSSMLQVGGSPCFDQMRMQCASLDATCCICRSSSCGCPCTQPGTRCCRTGAPQPNDCIAYVCEMWAWQLALHIRGLCMVLWCRSVGACANPATSSQPVALSAGGSALGGM
jgi:hypothetical protein